MISVELRSLFHWSIASSGAVADRWTPSKVGAVDEARSVGSSNVSTASQVQVRNTFKLYQNNDAGISLTDLRCSSAIVGEG